MVDDTVSTGILHLDVMEWASHLPCSFVGSSLGSPSHCAISPCVSWILSTYGTIVGIGGGGTAAAAAAAAAR